MSSRRKQNQTGTGASRDPQLLVCGYYGHDNAGNEAIPHGLIAGIRWRALFGARSSEAAAVAREDRRPAALGASTIVGRTTDSIP
jgi:hypothetical protein